MPWFRAWWSPWWGWGCRFYPWLPRHWWAYGAWPSWSYAVPPWGVPPWGAYVPPTVAPEEELSALKAQAQWLKDQLDTINKRIEELEKKG